MKSNEMWIVFWWLFRSSFTHSHSGRSRWYSRIYGICDIGKYDLIWFDLIRHSKSHWKQHSLRKRFILLHCWFTINKYFIISYSHSIDADGLRNFVLNCSNLRQLEIGDDSFEDFKSFELSNLNSIQSIKFGNDCFRYADFSLKGEWKERNVIWMKMKMMI